MNIKKDETTGTNLADKIRLMLETLYDDFICKQQFLTRGMLMRNLGAMVP